MSASATPTSGSVMSFIVRVTWTGAADALTIASAAYERAGAPVGAANTADSLADVLLRRR